TELACMVATRIGDAGGTVLVVAGSVLIDRLVGPEAVEWPGPSANRKFARNLLQFLSRSNVTSTPLEPFELISRIERTLIDTVRKGVRPKGDKDWWYECVPEPVRKKCAERHEQEKGRFPKAAYLDLLDLRSIIESNWKDFESMLGEAGWRGGR